MKKTMWVAGTLAVVGSLLVFLMLKTEASKPTDPISSVASAPVAAPPKVHMQLGERYECLLDVTKVSGSDAASYLLIQQSDDEARIECANATFMSPESSCHPDEVKRLIVDDPEEPVEAIDSLGRRIFIYSSSVRSVKLIFTCAPPGPPPSDDDSEESCPRTETQPPPLSA